VRAAVAGRPVAHSLSPVLHRAAYAELGLDWTYEAIECDEAGLPGLLAGLGPDWAGLSLTMPLKTAVLPLLDEVEPLATDVAAVNTVVLLDGVRRGWNTDVPGLVAALDEAGAPRPTTAAVLGGGATARSALAALARRGVRESTVYLRRPAAAADLEDCAARLGVDVARRPWAEAGEGLAAALVVSTVPAGAADFLAGCVPERPGTLFDVVYRPWPSPLATAWAGRRGRVVGGLDLLVHQAARQVLLMTGSTRSTARLVSVMRSAGRSALSRP